MALDYFYNVLKKDITMVKGDTMSFGFQLQGLDGSVPSDITFSCKNNPEDKDAVFTCKLSEEDGVWIDSEDTVHDILTYGVRVAPAKTEDLNTGRYFYDLEIDVNNDVFTLMKGRLLIEYDVTR